MRDLDLNAAVTYAAHSEAARAAYRDACHSRSRPAAQSPRDSRCVLGSAHREFAHTARTDGKNTHATHTGRTGRKAG
jgi:hypothetical protein